LSDKKAKKEVQLIL